MKINWEHEVLLITGVSSGLGLALAKKINALGAVVIGIARDEARLERVVKEMDARFFPFAFDLQMIEKIPHLYQQIIRKVQRPPTILVNNVGNSVGGFVQNTPVEIYERNFRVNLFAAIALIQAVLPDMLNNSRGSIVNIMSAVMYHSFPGTSAYCSSKAALGAIHESLRAELSDFPIQTLYVNPGGFRSRFFNNLDAGSRLGDYQFPEFGGSKDPSVVASAICNGIERGREKIDLGSFSDKIGQHLSYWAPRLLDRLIVVRNQKLLKNYLFSKKSISD